MCNVCAGLRAARRLLARAVRYDGATTFEIIRLIKLINIVIASMAHACMCAHTNRCGILMMTDGTAGRAVSDVAALSMLPMRLATARTTAGVKMCSQ